MNHSQRLLCAGVIALGGLAATSAQAMPELVTNGGFETGDLSGWSETQAPGLDSYYGVDTAGPRTGNYSLFYGGTAAGDSVSQTLATTAGTSYWIRFSLDAGATGQGSFTASLDGVQFYAAPLSGFAFQPVTVRVTATSTQSVLRFAGYNVDDFYTLDNVSAMAVPEPGTEALMLLGLAGLGIAAKRRRQS